MKSSRVNIFCYLNSAIINYIKISFYKATVFFSLCATEHNKQRWKLDLFLISFLLFIHSFIHFRFAPCFLSRHHLERHQKEDEERRKKRMKKCLSLILRWIIYLFLSSKICLLLFIIRKRRDWFCHEKVSVKVKLKINYTPYDVSKHHLNSHQLVPPFLCRFPLM